MLDRKGWEQIMISCYVYIDVCTITFLFAFAVRVDVLFYRNITE